MARRWVFIGVRCNQLLYLKGYKVYCVQREALRLGQIEKSLITDHCINEGHNIDWENSGVISFTKPLVPRLVKQSIEIFNHKGRALNNGNSPVLSKAWTTVLSCHWTLAHNRLRLLGTRSLL